MKSIIALALVALVLSQTAPTVPNTKTDVEEFLAGFLLGLRATTFVPHGIGCILEALQWKGVLAQVKADFQNKTVSSVVSGIQLLTHTLDESAQLCGDTVVETSNYIKNITQTIKDPQWKKQAVQALLNHADVVGEDVAATIEAFEGKDYITAGAKVGDILGLAIWLSPNTQ